MLYQGILINYVGQDCSVFNGMPLDKFAQYRKQTSDMFIRIYECAREVLKSPHDMSIPLGRAPLIPPELNQEMFDRGAKYSKVDGSPIMSSLPKDLAVKYEKISAEFIRVKIERSRHQAAGRILDPSNDVVIKNYFISRYSREPIDFKECKEVLVQLRVKDKMKFDIICTIAKGMQIIPPKDICLECGIKTGDGEF